MSRLGMRRYPFHGSRDAPSCADASCGSGPLCGSPGAAAGTLRRMRAPGGKSSKVSNKCVKVPCAPK